jgi:hypothetical protein
MKTVLTTSDMASFMFNGSQISYFGKSRRIRFETKLKGKEKWPHRAAIEHYD